MDARCTKLSESPRDSDRLESEGRKTVRKEAAFGQEWGQGVQSCQKGSGIWTRMGERCTKLSESPRDSDRLESEGRKTVRKEAAFGQEWGQGAQSCQKAPGIQTG
jgi:hypothetical protein